MWKNHQFLSSIKKMHTCVQICKKCVRLMRAMTVSLKLVAQLRHKMNEKSQQVHNGSLLSQVSVFRAPPTHKSET